MGTGTPRSAERRPLLAVRGVSKSFGGLTAVDQVSFDVGPAESVGLVGPNGAGKTTLFNCICGQERPGGGSAVLDGTILDGLAPYQRSRLGIGRTFQRVEVFAEMTVREHLVVAIRAHQGGGRLWRDLLGRSAPRPDERARVAEVVELTGIGRIADVPVASLGLGACRLVELARALVTSPILLMADEPSSGLDAYETRELAGVLRTVQRERSMAILLVEHDLDMVAKAVDRVVVMDLGRIVAQGPFAEVMADPTVQRAYLGTPA